MADDKNDEGMSMEEFKALPDEAAPPEDIQAKPFPNEHAARLKPPALYKRFRRQNDKFGSGVHAIWGVRKDNDKVELQALRFAVAKFTAAQARAWLKEHDYTATLFEPASGKEADPERNSGEGASDNRDVKTEDDITKLARYERELAAEDARVTFGKDADGGSYIEGYASQFGVKDLQNDIVEKGAFTKTIAERGAKGKIPLMVRHVAAGGNLLDIVGVAVDLKEDDYGLWFHATWNGTPRAQEVHQLVNELLEKGVRIGTSIGYKYDQWEKRAVDSEQVTVHKAVKLIEITMTLMPACEGAYVTGSKSMDAALQVIFGSKTGTLAREDASRLLGELEGQEKAQALADELESAAGKIKDLIAAAQPQDTKSDAGSTEPGDSAAAAEDGADLHSLHARVKAIKRKARYLELT